jgi:hypothetical protein
MKAEVLAKFHIYMYAMVLFGEITENTLSMVRHNSDPILTEDEKQISEKERMQEFFRFPIN